MGFNSFAARPLFNSQMKIYIPAHSRLISIISIYFQFRFNPFHTLSGPKQHLQQIGAFSCKALLRTADTEQIANGKQQHHESKGRNKHSRWIGSSSLRVAVANAYKRSRSHLIVSRRPKQMTCRRSFRKRKHRFCWRYGRGRTEQRTASEGTRRRNCHPAQKAKRYRTLIWIVHEIQATEPPPRQTWLPCCRRIAWKRWRWTMGSWWWMRRITATRQRRQRTARS